MKHRLSLLTILGLFLIVNGQIINIERGGLKTASFQLNNGLTMPALGFGTSRLGNSTITKNAIKSAIQSGYRLIDTATSYNNEADIGEALSELFKEQKIKREDVFITTKVWPNNYTPDRVRSSIENSLKKLKVNRLDLVLLHFPAAFQSGEESWPLFANGTVMPLKWEKNSFLGTWKAMEDAVDANLTQSIGISNFNAKQVDILMEKARIKPVVNQVECNPLFNQKDLLENHKRHKIILQAYAPIGRANPEILTNSVLQSIGSAHNKTSAQTSIRWLLQRGAALVIKSSNPKRIGSNLDVFDFKLTDEEMTMIDQLPQGPRAFGFVQARTHPDYPF